MSENGTIHVEIDPHKPLPERYLGTGEDGPGYGPMSLYDAIIQAAANQLVQRALKDDGLKEGYMSLVEHVRRVRDEMIREAIAPVIAEALSKPLRKTNTFGEESGPETTLRELIVERGRAELQAKKDRFGAAQTVLSEVIRDEVGSALDKELRAALAAGKSELLNTLQTRGLEVMQESMRKALPL